EQKGVDRSVHRYCRTSLQTTQRGSRLRQQSERPHVADFDVPGSGSVRPRLLIVSAALAAILAAGAAGQSKSEKYKGLEITVTSVERGTNVSLTDCPPGANTVRGVIRPGDTNEFASVKVDFKVTSDFKAGTMLPKPTLT